MSLLNNEMKQISQFIEVSMKKEASRLYCFVRAWYFFGVWWHPTTMTKYHMVNEYDIFLIYISTFQYRTQRNEEGADCFFLFFNKRLLMK